MTNPRRPVARREKQAGDDTIQTVRIIIYTAAFAIVIGIGAAIALLSLSVAPADARTSGLTMLAVGLGGLGVAGGVVYLAEKLINLAKGVAFMLAELIVEKFKKRERAIGREEGREEGRAKGREEGREEGRAENQLAWRAWHRRQQEALRSGVPFDEPPPGSDSEDNNHPGASS